MIAPVAGAGGRVDTRPRAVRQATRARWSLCAVRAHPVRGPPARLAAAGKGSMLGPVTRALPRLALALAVASAACIPSGELVAIDGSHRMLARDPQTGVSVVLTTGAWQGIPSDLDEQITVLHVLVANMGNRPVRLAPGDLDLVDERGFRRDLLDAGGSFVQQGENDSGYHPGRRLDYGRIEWVGGDVASSALPWGVLQPGTSMRGYLYFERVDNRANSATLTWHFADDKGQSLVDLAFDLYVARPR